MRSTNLNDYKSTATFKFAMTKLSIVTLSKQDSIIETKGEK